MRVSHTHSGIIHPSDEKYLYVMAIKKRVIRRRATGKPPSRPAGNLSFSTNQPENYLELGLDTLKVGKSSGLFSVGSTAFTMHSLNANSQIGLGTSVNQRLGQHIILTRLLVRLCVTTTLGARFRIVVVANPRDGTINGIAGNTAQTAFMEASPLLRAPPVGTVIGPIDYPMDPTTDYTVLHDKMYGFGDHSRSFTEHTTVTDEMPIGSVTTPVELDIDLMLPVTFNNSNVPTSGDFCMYMCSTSPNGFTLYDPVCQVWGTVRLQYVNAMNLEAIGRTIRDIIDESDKTIAKARESPFARWLMTAAQFATRTIFGF